MTVVSDSIARAFKSSRATRAVALDVPKVWHASLLRMFRSYGISG